VVVLKSERTQVDVFEAELMEKVSKQQRSKMNRVQVLDQPLGFGVWGFRLNFRG